MNARFTIAAFALTVVASTQASASILSASNSAAHARMESTDYLRVDAVQDQLNASLADRTDASGSFAGSAPTLGSSGGFLVTTGAGATFSNSSFSNRGRGGYGGGGGGILEWNRRLEDTRPLGRPGSTRGGTGSTNTRDRRDDRRGGTHATPEPSTWMLLGTGLMMIGLYAAMRRRQSVSL